MTVQAGDVGFFSFLFFSQKKDDTPHTVFTLTGLTQQLCNLEILRPQILIRCVFHVLVGARRLFKKCVGESSGATAEVTCLRRK